VPGKKNKTIDVVRVVRPRLPGPWQYLDLLPMLTALRNLSRDLPPAAYPLLALVAWRTIQSDRRKYRQALLQAEREAIRRSQPVFIAKPPRKKRFLLF